MKFVQQLWWKKQIKHWAHELGFVSIGFTTSQPIIELGPVLQTRSEKGLSSPFEAKNIEQRIDPQRVWTECQTVIVLAYPLPLSLPPQEGEGVIARSAVGRDYHLVLQEKIQELGQIMVNHGWSGTHRIQVDTGPLVERAFAVRAAVGWIGKNQQLIVPGYGSFVSLGLLLLDLTLPPDQPIHKQCGPCQKCIDSCPVQIIGIEPFETKRCISNLTQCKEILTPEEGKQLGLRLFGCDTCQESCPHNSERIREENVLLSSLNCGVDLLDTLMITKAEFERGFKLTSAGWRGKGVLQRNAFLAMKNRQDVRYELWLAERKKDKMVPPMVAPYL